MLVPLAETRERLTPTGFDWGKAASHYHRVGPGEGGFRFARPTVGFVLTPQLKHIARYGGDRVTPMPLQAGMGWVLPAEVDGWCAWDAPSDFLNVEIDPATFAAAGLDTQSLRIGAQIADPMLIQMAMTLHLQAATTDPIATLYRETLTMGIAAHIAQGFTAMAAPPAAPAPLDRRLQRVIDYIEAHIAEALTIEALATIAVMSPFHFAKAFRKATGQPPHKFVAARRIERAKALVTATTLPVSEIAIRVGWDNPAHFTATFKALTGHTPGAFRQLARA